MAATAVRRALLYVPASSPRFLQKSTALTVDNVTYDLEDSVTPSRKADARKDLRLFLHQRHLEQQEKRRREKKAVRGGSSGGGTALASIRARDGVGDGDDEEVSVLDSLRRGEGVRKRDGIGEVAVRINSVDSGYALDDLVEVLQAPNIDALVIPKVNSAADLKFVTDVIKHHAPSRLPTITTPTRTTKSHSNLAQDQDEEQDEPPQNPILLLALIESAQSLLNLPSITSFSHSTPTFTSTPNNNNNNNNNNNPSTTNPHTNPIPTLATLIFAAEDFAHDLSITRTPSLSEFLYARSAIVTAARAARIPSVIDLVSVAYKTPSSSSPNNNNNTTTDDNNKTQNPTQPLTLTAEAQQGASLGFTGKQLIHPSQVDPVQSIFGVSHEQAEWAVRVLVGDEKARREGKGAWTLMPEGMMVDRPVVRRAEGLVRRASREGLNLRRVLEEGGG